MGCGCKHSAAFTPSEITPAGVNADRSAFVSHEASTLRGRGPRTNPATNQAGHGSVYPTPDSEALHANASRLVRQMNPLYFAGHGGFRGFIGVLAVKPASVKTVISPQLYQGALPMSQQPLVDKAQPFARPTLMNE